MTDEPEPKFIPNPRYCERCQGRGYLVGDAEWEPYAIQCPDCKARRNMAQEALKIVDRAEKAEAEIERLKVAAKSSLLVLCTARAGQSWHENMLKDFDFAIDCTRRALGQEDKGNLQCPDCNRVFAATDHISQCPTCAVKLRALGQEDEG